jgi:molybdate transport system substrate-binding protein
MFRRSALALTTTTAAPALTTFSYDASSTLATQADNGAQALATAGVKAQPTSLEANVKAVVTKVTSGQVDAGIGYVTDAKAAAATADGVTIDDKDNVVAEYPIAVLKQSKNQNVAYAFLDYILGPDAQAILAKYGFTGP